MPARILLIDNDCATLCALLQLLSAYDVTVLSWGDCHRVLHSTEAASEYSLVVLSPGRPISVAKNHDELDFVSHTCLPVIGLCYGFQILAHAFGGRMEPLIERRLGLLDVSFVAGIAATTNAHFRAFGDHSYAVKHLPPSLTGLAQSVDGYEIVRVAGRSLFGIQFHPELGGNECSAARQYFLSLVLDLTCSAKRDAVSVTPHPGQRGCPARR